MDTRRLDLTPYVAGQNYSADTFANRIRAWFYWHGYHVNTTTENSYTHPDRKTVVEFDFKNLKCSVYGTLESFYQVALNLDYVSIGLNALSRYVSTKLDLLACKKESLNVVDGRYLFGLLDVPKPTAFPPDACVDAIPMERDAWSYPRCVRDVLQCYREHVGRGYTCLQFASDKNLIVLRENEFTEDVIIYLPAKIIFTSTHPPYFGTEWDSVWKYGR